MATPAMPIVSQRNLPTLQPVSANTTIDPVESRNREVWCAGDFDRIAAGYRAGASEFVGRQSLKPTSRVLDLACGTGNLSLPAAMLGAQVVGLDIAANLLETARARASSAELNIRFDEGNAEHPPYADHSFDVILSMFGAMFAPRPEKVLAGMRRILRPGGCIAMANWTPDSFIGDMFRAHTALVPPAPGIPSPLLWGDEGVVRERFSDAQHLNTVRRTIRLEYPVTPRETVQLFRDWYGPTLLTFRALNETQQESLFQSLLDLWTERNESSNGTTSVESDYLEVVVTLPIG